MEPAPSSEATTSEPEHQPLRTAIAVLIAIVSVLGAVVAWRASVTSIRASDLDEDGTLELVQRQQELAILESTVDSDFVLFTRYQHHIKNWRLLQGNAEKVESTNPELADALTVEAQGELALSRSLRPLFRAGTPDFGDEEGTAVYDRKFVLRNLMEGSEVLRQLRPEATFGAAREEHRRTVNLVAIVTMFIASLFFLTLAQFARPETRRVFAAAGLLVAVAGTVLFALVEASG